MPPLIVAAIVVPIVAGFAFVGPQLGLALGALAVGGLLVGAARMSGGYPIETRAATDMKRRALVVLLAELDDEAVAAIKRAAELDRAGGEVELLVIAPATGRPLDRWAMDLERSRDEAQRRLVMSVAALGKADVAARAMVGDPDVVLAVEDGMRTFAATEVILVAGPAGADERAERAARELEARLVQPLSRVEAGPR